MSRTTKLSRSLWLAIPIVIAVCEQAEAGKPPAPAPSAPVAYRAVWFEEVAAPPEVTAVLGTGSALNDINDSLSAVGSAHWYDGQQWHLRAAIAVVKYTQAGVPYLESHRLDEFTQPLPAGQYLERAFLINNAGIVVGRLGGDGPFGAFVCDTTTTPFTVHYLPPLEFDVWIYQRMNEHGDLTLEGPYVGGAASQWVAVPPYAYGGVDDPTDDFYKLPPEVHDAYGINDNLQVVAVDSASSRVCVYQLDLGGTFTRTAVLGTNAGMSQGQINSAGVIAHWTPYYYRKNSARAVLARTGAPYTTTEPLTTITSNPQDINSDAQICGYANDLHRGFVFHPQKGFWILDDLVFPKNDTLWFDPLSHSNDGHALTNAYFPVTEGTAVYEYPAICGQKQNSGTDSFVAGRGYVLLPQAP